MHPFLKYSLVALFLLSAGCGDFEGSVDTPVVNVASSPPPTSAASTGIGLTAKEWNMVYNGYGSVTFDSNGITLSPKEIFDRNEAPHAALVLLRPTESCPVRDFNLTIHAVTRKQLNYVDPKPWEVFWIFFNYRAASNNTKTTNYFIVKTNGIELGKAYDELGQDFLFTSANPKLKMGVETKYNLIRRGNIFSVLVNDLPVLTYNQSSPRVKPLYNQSGSIGLYTEEAQVEIRSVTLQPLDAILCR